MKRKIRGTAPRIRFRLGLRAAGPVMTAIGVALLGGVDVAGGVDQALPEAATILDKYVEVTGGVDAYQKVHNRVAKVRVVHVGMGFEDSMTEYHASPNKRYLVMESEALGGMQQGTDGEVAWYLSAQTGPLIEEGEARAATLENAAFDRVWNWREYYTHVECVAEEAIDEKDCYKVVLTPKHGETETRYYDKQTNLLVRADIARLSSHMPTVRAQLTMSDYRWVDGLLLPHDIKHESSMCGNKREMQFVVESMAHNVDLPADRFDLPEEVQAASTASRLASVGRALKSSLSPGNKSGTAGGGPCCGSQQKGSAKQQPGCGGRKGASDTKRPGCGG